MAERKYASMSSITSLVRNITSRFSQIGHKHTSSEITDLKIPTKVSELTNDASYVTTSVTDGLSEAISGKANTSHTHSISNVTNLQSSLDAKVPTSRTVNGKALTGNISLTASDVGADASGAANTALNSAKEYTDEVAEGKANATHTHTKAEVGLGNVDNTADSAKSVKYATSAGSATSATSATKATQDASGNVITTTYETKANASTKYDELTEAIGGKSDTGHTHSIAICSWLYHKPDRAGGAFSLPSGTTRFIV